MLNPYAAYFFIMVYGAVLAGVAAAQGTCSADALKNRFSVDAPISFPEPYKYCFKIKVNKCTAAGSACCSNLTTSTFQIDVDEACSYDTFMATFNGQPLGDITALRPNGWFGAGVLSISNLTLNASAIEAAGGALLCIHLNRDTNCGGLTRLIPVGTKKWNATLSSANGKCCPLTTLKLPQAKCETCLVWDVLGPDGTAASTKYDFTSRTSCSLGAADPSELAQKFASCCDYLAYWAMYGKLNGLRAAGIVSGFNKPVCTRTSLRLCGAFSSKAEGQAFAADRAYMGGLREDFDGTDDTCAMGLINSTIRLRALVPSSDALDGTCAPISERIDDTCSEPDRGMPSVYYPAFPNSWCDSRVGVTPFTINKIYEPVYYKSNSSLTAYCVSINTTREQPQQPNSFCGNSTSLDKISFWMFDDEYRRQSYLGGAYMLTKEGTRTTRTNLTAVWGPQDEMLYSISGLGLDVATVAAKQPKVCIEALNTRLWFDTVDALGYLWTALQDKSGQCCPVYYANRF